MFSVVAVLFVNYVLVQSRDYLYYDLKDVALHFEDFIITYDKQYNSELEKFKRLMIFVDNLMEYNRKNKESSNAVYGITKFSDLTQEEFIAHHTGLKGGMGGIPCTVSVSEANASITVPDTFDWRTKNAVSRVKDQQFCGSCWAFGATGAVESQYAIKYNKLLELSDQQLVDCDKRSEGCDGTKQLENPFYYLIENGAMLQKDYPYKGREEHCKYDRSKVNVKLAGCRNLKVNKDEEKLKKLLYQYGPATIGVDASDLPGYQSGIIRSPQCDTNAVNHAVLLVGYGSENGVPFWIVKNSWAESWGERGYFRIERGIDCINLTAASPVQAIVV